MKFYKYLFLLSLFFIAIIFSAEAQSYIKLNGFKINHLDKKSRKQGEWIFFDSSGNVQMSCLYKDDICVSPLIFYENSDTAFVRFPEKNHAEVFLFYKHDKIYQGKFINLDSNSIIQIDNDSEEDETIFSGIRKYQHIIIRPVYYFAQKKMVDYLSASFSSSNIIFNKPYHVVLSISSSGIITKVEFPPEKNNLSANEQNELRWIYETMPRWQPLYFKNETKNFKMIFSGKSSLSILSFD